MLSTDIEGYSLIVIDEAHTFLSPDTKRGPGGTVAVSYVATKLGIPASRARVSGYFNAMGSDTVQRQERQIVQS